MGGQWPAGMAGSGAEGEESEVAELRRTLFARLGRLESELRENAGVAQRNAEAIHELAAQVSYLEDDVHGLEGEVRASKATSGGCASHGGGFTGGQAGAMPECRDAEVRAERAELELRASRAEMEAKALRSELELRAYRAEQELAYARAQDAARLPPQLNALASARAQARERAGARGSARDLLATTLPPLNLDFARGPGPVNSLNSDVDGFSDLGTQDACWSLDPVTVMGKYEMNFDDFLGQGGFSIVRKGLDVTSFQKVAVKCYSEMESFDGINEEYEDIKSYYLSKFRNEVDVFQQLHTEQDMRSLLLLDKRAHQTRGRDARMSWFIPDALVETDSSSMKAFDNFPRADQLFVRLLDFSRERGRDEDDEDYYSSCSVPRPGPDVDGICYVVLELADYTLHEFLQVRKSQTLPLSRAEVKLIFTQLAQIIAALHARNFVHADLKPMNVMHFPCGRWKLIDMDGMIRPGAVPACDLCYTPLYCAPEMAAQCTERKEEIEVSRHLDVWSLAMSAMEVVTLEPVLEHKFQEFGGDVTAFLDWLVKSQAPIEIPLAVLELDPLLADLFRQMLNRDTRLRFSMIEVLVHPFFAGDVDAVVEETVASGRSVAHTGSLLARTLVYRTAAARLMLVERRQEALNQRRDTLLRRKSTLPLTCSQATLSLAELAALRGAVAAPELADLTAPRGAAAATYRRKASFVRELTLGMEVPRLWVPLSRLAEDELDSPLSLPTTLLPAGRNLLAAPPLPTQAVPVLLNLAAAGATRASKRVARVASAQPKEEAARGMCTVPASGRDDDGRLQPMTRSLKPNLEEKEVVKRQSRIECW